MFCHWLVVQLTIGGLCLLNNYSEANLFFFDFRHTLHFNYEIQILLYRSVIHASPAGDLMDAQPLVLGDYIN